MLWFLLAVTIDVSFFYPQHSEGLGVGDLIWRKPGIRLGGTPSLDVTSKESSRRHCLAFWGGVQVTHVTDSINFKQKEVVFASKKKTCRSFFREDWSGATPLTNESAPNAKKNAKNGSLRWLPPLGSTKSMWFSGKKPRSIFDKSPFQWVDNSQR